MEGRLGPNRYQIYFSRILERWLSTLLACLPGQATHHHSMQLTGLPGAHLPVATLPLGCLRSKSLPVPSSALKRPVAPNCSWDKAQAQLGILGRSPALRPNCSLSPTPKIVQPLRAPPTRPAVAMLASPSPSNPGPPLLLVTSFPSLKSNSSSPSSRQPSLIPPVLRPGRGLSGPPASPDKEPGTQDGPHPGVSQGYHLPRRRERPACPSASRDPAHLFCGLTSGSPFQGQLDFYLPGPAPGNPATPASSPGQPLRWTNPPAACLQHLLSPVDRGGQKNLEVEGAPPGAAIPLLRDTFSP